MLGRFGAFLVYEPKPKKRKPKKDAAAQPSIPNQENTASN